MDPRLLARTSSLASGEPVAATDLPCAHAPGTPPELAKVLEMRYGLSADQVRMRLSVASRQEEGGKRVLAFYLVEMDERRLYQASGHASTAHYARVRLDMDRRRVGELLRVGRKLLELPLLDRAYCEGRLRWSKVLEVAAVATPEHEAAWVEKALELDLDELRLLVMHSRAGGAPRTDGHEKGLPEIRFRISGKVDALSFATIEQAQRKLSAELGHEVDEMELLAVLSADLLATQPDGTVPGRKRIDGSIYRVEVSECCKRHRSQGRPLTVETELGPVPVDGEGPGRASAMSEAIRCDAGVRTWHTHGQGHCTDHRDKDVQTPKKMRTKVMGRDRYCCRSCRSPRAASDLMVHHIEFRSHGGRTLPQNLITLCERCHGLVHADLLVIRGDRAEEALFLDAEGRPVNAPILAGLDVLFKAIEPPEPRPATVAAQVDDTVTLSRVPREIDAGWWRRHAHLVKDRGEHGQLTFAAGRPIEAEPIDPIPVAPREQAFAGMVGQAPRIERLTLAAERARARGKRFPHVLLTGPAGTGKTTLARGIAAVAQQPLVVVDASLVGDRAALVRLLAGLEEGTVLFLDEAHALAPALQDALLLALAEQKLALLLSDGTRARGVTLRLPAFTLVAATTDEGSLARPLRDRFQLRETLVAFGEAALAEVVQVVAHAQGAEVTPEGARRIAEAARGTPRRAVGLTDQALGEVEVPGTPEAAGSARVVTREHVDRMLERQGYDALLLDEGEQRYLEVLRASQRPMSLARLASALGTTLKSVAECIEPWLLKLGLVITTPGGRVATPALRPAAWSDRVSDGAADGAYGAPDFRQQRPRWRSRA